MLMRILVINVVSLVFVTSAFAGGAVFYGGSDHLWTTGSNWEQGLPTSSDWCFITYSATSGNGPIVQAGNTAVGGNVVLGWGGWGEGTTTMTITGGSLNIANDIWIGKDDSQVQPEAPGVIDISGGVLTVGGYFAISSGCNGTVNQTGGTVNSNILVLDWLDNTTDPETGVYNLYGGTLNVANLYVRPDGLIDIKEGVMIVAGDMSWYMRDIITAGRLTAYGGKGTVIYDYDISNSGNTTVRAQAPQGADLMINGSFESPDIPASTSQSQSPVNWLVAQGITMIDSSTITSNGSQFVEFAPVGNSSGKFWQIKYLAPGNYILSFDYAAKAGVSGDRELLINTYDKDSATGNQTNVAMRTLQFNHQNNPADPNWLHAEYNVIISGTAEFSVVEFECPAYGNSAIWLDNVTLVPDLNLLANGSFELPDVPAGMSLSTSPYGWAVYQGVTVTDDAAIAADKDQFVEVASGDKFFQIMYLKPGEYSLSFNYAAKAGVAGVRNFTVTTFDIENPNVSGPLNIAIRNLSFTHQNNPEDPNWLHAEYGFSVGSSAYETLLEIECLGTSSEVWIDNVKVKPAVTGITDGFKQQAGTGWDIFVNSGVNYRYGPSFIINDDGSIDMWSASPPDSGSEWDWIKYKRSTDNGVTWSAETIALRPTTGSLDSYSVCDPGVIKFGGYYYIGYTSTTNSSGVENDTFVARSTSPSGPYEKWNGSGWGGNPQPIIEYTDTAGGFGCGEPSFVVNGGVLYIYYTWNSGNGLPQTRVATADATNPNWPAAMTFHGVAIQKANSNSDSDDIKFVDSVGKFIAVNTANRLTDQSYIQVWTSLDGLTFNLSGEVRANIQPYCHNIGISGDELGHINSSEAHFIAYAYGANWGRWSTHLNPVTICDTDYAMDFNQDCVVDFKDFADLASEWMQNTAEKDFDQSGTVDFADLEEFANYWLHDTRID